MNWLVLSYFLSLGTLSYTQTWPIDFSSPEYSFQTTVGVEAEGIDNHLFLGASVETWETIASPGNGIFNPWESLYIFSAGFRADGFELGWRHECDHPVLWNTETGATGFLARRDELYLSYKASVKLF